MFVLTAFICCGLARLARFNATAALRTGSKTTFFEGLPIPSSLGLVAVMAYWTQQGWIEGGEGVPLGVACMSSASGKCWGEYHRVSMVFGVWAAMMVSKTLRVPKL